MQKRVKSQKKFAKLTAAVALSAAIVSTSIPLTGMEVKAEDTSAAQANVIIPKPLEYTADADGGTFSLEADSEIYVSGDSEVTEIAEYLQEEFGKSTGYELPVSEGSDTSSGDILLAADGDESLGEEGYTVTVGENGVKISAYTPHGIFNGVQTLRQLFPADIENTSVVSDVEWTASYCEIYDKPEYSYRGAMIDSARHFHSVESVKRQIDHMAKYKINKLHLRLADDQGWRLEIKGETETGESYDKLRTIGASTSCSTNGYRPGQYTQEEFRELAEYAADHYVEIIPEFDMPGHSWAALVSLEYLNSTEDGKPHSGNYDNTKPYDGWDVGFSTLECRNENTYKFIEDVISQAAPLYPSEYIHIGGDEAHSTSAEDYTYFMNRVTEIAQKYGKTPIGWQNYDTVVESTVEDKDNTVTQYWLTDGAKYKEGVKYMVSPANYAYMDMIYDSSCPYGLQWAGPNPIDDAYSWNPTDYLPEGGSKDQIIGIEAPLFGETIATDEAMDYMMYPRLMGHAEIGWTPKENRDWNEYKTRMIAHGDRLRNQGIGFFEDEDYWEKPVVPMSTVWSMDEGEGTQIMDAGQEYAGTVSGEVQWTEGKYGTALKFSNGYVDLDTGDMNKKWTIAMWVNREDNPATNSTLICGAEGEIKLEQYNDTNKVGLTQFGVVDETFDYEAPVGEWVHLAFVSDGSSTSLYVNGALTDTIDLVITAPADRIGANTKGGLADTGALKGSVDELKIVNRALSAEEVAGLADEASVPVDLSLLETAVETASKVNLDSYVTEGKEAFEAAKAAAEAMLESGAQTQAEVNRTCTALDNARLALKLKADKSQLAVQVQNAEKALDTEGQYTEASLAELRAVYDQYISVWENDELSTDDQDLVTEAKEALEAALANLVEAGESFAAEWDMDEGEGTVINDKGGIHPGTLSGGVAWTEGKNGSGLAFDGESGYVDLGLEDMSGPWTAAMWVNKEQMDTTNAVLLSGDEGEIKLEQYENTKKVGITRFGEADYTYDYVAPEGQWVHLAFVSDGSSTSLYVNGGIWETLDASISCPAKRIGANDKTGLEDAGYLKASLDEVKIFGRALSDQEVAELAGLDAPPVIINKNYDEAPVYDIESNELMLPTAEGYKIEVFGSDNEATVSLDGEVTRPLTDQTVKLLYRITNESDGTSFTTEKNAVITIPAAENQVSGDNEKPAVIPELREWVGGDGEIDLTDARIVLGDEDFRAAAETLQEDYADLTGREIEIVSGGEESLEPGDIYLSMADGEEMLGEEGYYLNIGGDDASEDYVEIRAIDNTGSLYGGISVLQILKQDEGRDNLPRGLARDYPLFDQRGMHLDVARKWIPMEYLEDLAKQMSWYKLNMLALHLSDNDIWEGLSTDNGSNGAAQGWFRLESETFPELTSEDHYTKEEFRNLQYECMDLGIDVISELDTPGHALAYTRAWGEETARYDNPKYLDVLNPQVLENAKALFDEYINGYNGGEPTFVGEYVNIGTDEYKTDGLPSADRTAYREGFRQYCNDLLEYVGSTGKEAVFWGSLTENSGETPVTTDATMFAWYRGYANAKESLDAGYKIVSMEDQEMYIVPGGSSYPEQFGRAEYLYNNWLPNNNSGWAGNPAPDGHPGVSGGQFAVWNDFHGNGISVNDISYRIQHNLYAVAEKTWAGNQAKNEGRTFADVQALAAELGDAPNADFMYEVDKNVADNELLKLDGTVENTAEAGAEITGSENVTENAEGRNGTALRFNGGSSYLTTDIKSPGFGWTAAMWIKPESGGDGVLMEGKTGTLRLEEGKLKYDVENYTHTFDCELAADEWTHIALTGTYEGVTLYINGEKFDSLIGKPFPNWNVNSGCTLDDGRGYPVNEDGVRTQRYYETLMLPMEVIGSRENAVKASIDELYIYDRILNENEIIRLSGAQIPINVALNKEVTVGNYHSASTEADRSGAKAVDGDLTSRWEFDLYNTDTNYIQIPLNADESVEKVVIRQMVWGGVNRITKIRITAVNDGAETEILPETAYDGGEIDSANQIAVKEIDLGQSVKADAVKIYLTPKAAGSDDLVNIRELELYGTISAEEPEPVSKSILERYLNDAKDWVEKGEVDSCVESIRKLFDEAIAEGEAVMADADATRDEVVDAARKLMLAINALNMKAADKTDLSMAVELAGMIDLGRYVEAGQQEFLDTLAFAEEALADGDTMQPGADQAWSALVDAMGSLRLKADKDVLEELLSQAEGLDLTQYTEGSAAVFRMALASAQAVFADQTLSVEDQQTVDDAVASLKMAAEDLTVKADGSDKEEQSGNNSDNGNAADTGNTGNVDNGGSSVNNTQKAAKTGDAAQFGMSAVMVLMSGLVILKMRRGRA